MESKARFLGHSVHQSLVGFPLGMLAAAVATDLIGLLAGGASPALALAAFWVMTLGIVAGLVAAPFGLVDLLAIPAGTRAARIGRLHGAGNVVVIALFVASWSLRYLADDYIAGATALALSFAGAALALGTAWLGGELVSRLGVGVSEGANVDAPSSLDRERQPVVRAR